MQMFEGEFESLSALKKAGCIRVPKPIKAVKRDGNGAVLIMEYVDIQGLGSKTDQLGNELANLHLHNIKLGEQGDPGFVSKFGFHVQTCCGYLPQGNAWDDDWPVISCCSLKYLITYFVLIHVPCLIKQN